MRVHPSALKHGVDPEDAIQQFLSTGLVRFPETSVPQVAGESTRLGDGSDTVMAPLSSGTAKPWTIDHAA